MQNKYLTRVEAAQYLTERGLPISKSTLGKYACTGGGPVYQMFGSRSLYTPASLDAWIDVKLTAPRYSTSRVAA